MDVNDYQLDEQPLNDIFSLHIDPYVFRSVCKKFYYYYPNNWWQKQYDKYHSKVTLDEVLPLINKENNRFYVISEEDDVLNSYRFILDTDNSYFNIGIPTGLYQTVTKTLEEIKKLNVIKFDLGTYKRVLLEVRDCPGKLTKRLLYKELETMYTKEIKDLIFMHASGKVMGVKVESLQSKDVYKEIKRIIEKIAD